MYRVLFMKKLLVFLFSFFILIVAFTFFSQKSLAANVGDICISLNASACSDDHKSVLFCSAGKWTSIQSCSTGKACVNNKCVDYNCVISIQYCTSGGTYTSSLNSLCPANAPYACLPAPADTGVGGANGPPTAPTNLQATTFCQNTASGVNFTWNTSPTATSYKESYAGYSAVDVGTATSRKIPASSSCTTGPGGCSFSYNASVSWYVLACNSHGCTPSETKTVITKDCSPSATKPYCGDVNATVTAKGKDGLTYGIPGSACRSMAPASPNGGCDTGEKPISDTSWNGVNIARCDGSFLCCNKPQGTGGVSTVPNTCPEPNGPDYKCVGTVAECTNSSSQGGLEGVPDYSYNCQAYGNPNSYCCKLTPKCPSGQVSPHLECIGPVCTTVATCGVNSCSNAGDSCGSTPPKTSDHTKINLIIGLDGIGHVGDQANTNWQSGTNTATINGQTVSNPIAGSNQSPLTDPRPFTISVAGVAHDASFAFDKTGGVYKGTVDLGTTLASGNYVVTVSTTGHLVKKSNPVAITAGSDQNNVPQMNLVAGDISGDNKLDLPGDYNVILSCMDDPDFANTVGTTLCDTAGKNYKKLTDLEDNGVIDKFDYNLFVREFSKIQQGD
jgi:hypothetical protein